LRHTFANFIFDHIRPSGQNVFHAGLRIAGVFEVVDAFFRGEGVEGWTERLTP
jgi:hypothetical protein